MPCFTYLSPEEYKSPVSCKELQSTLEEVINLTGLDWRIAEFEMHTGKLWWKKKIKRYMLFVADHKILPFEFQIVHLYPSEEDTNSGVFQYEQYSAVSSYLIGILCGITLCNFNRKHRNGSDN